jgi:hypothetical protein
VTCCWPAGTTIATSLVHDEVTLIGFNFTFDFAELVLDAADAGTTTAAAISELTASASPTVVIRLTTTFLR